MSTNIIKNTSVVLYENQATSHSANCNIQVNCAGDNDSPTIVDEKSILTDLQRPTDEQSVLHHVSDSAEIKENVSSREIENSMVLNIDLHSEIQKLIYGVVDKIDVQQLCSGSDILQSTNENSVSLPHIDVKNDSEIDQLPISVEQEEASILRCDPVTCTSESKTKRHSFWRRTKRFVRRIFCCGASTSKVERFNSGLLVDQTDSEVENINLPSAIMQEPELATGLPRPTTDESLPEIALEIENIRAPAEMMMALGDCEFESVRVSSPQESRIIECDESNLVVTTKRRSMWRRLFC